MYHYIIRFPVPSLFSPGGGSCQDHGRSGHGHGPPKTKGMPGAGPRVRRLPHHFLLGGANTDRLESRRAVFEQEHHVSRRAGAKLQGDR